MQRTPLALVLLTALPLTAHAGTVDLEVGTGTARITTVAEQTATKTFAVGRFQVRAVVLQHKDAEGHWRWDVRLERDKDGATEVLVHPVVVTAVGMEGILETDSRLGPVKVHCRD